MDEKKPNINKTQRQLAAGVDAERGQKFVGVEIFEGRPGMQDKMGRGQMSERGHSLKRGADGSRGTYAR